MPYLKLLSEMMKKLPKQKSNMSTKDTSHFYTFKYQSHLSTETANAPDLFWGVIISKL